MREGVKGKGFANGAQTSTRGSYSTVQAKIFTQLIRSDAGLRVGKTFVRCAKIVRVLLIMLHDEFAQVIRQGHISRLRGGGELGLCLLGHVERYVMLFRLREICGGCNNAAPPVLFSVLA
jgi:hypothetical protein